MLEQPLLYSWFAECVHSQADPPGTTASCLFKDVLLSFYNLINSAPLLYVYMYVCVGTFDYIWYTYMGAQLWRSLKIDLLTVIDLHAGVWWSWSIELSSG